MAVSLAESMYGRRLLLLASIICAGMIVPIVAVGRITLYKGEQLRQAAEDNLVSTIWLPTSRGRLLDRKDRVLASDRPSFDIAVDYPVITGQWAFSQAARRARRANREIWKSLSTVQREALVQAELPAFTERLESGWRQLASIAGVTLDDVEERKSAITADVARQAANVWERQRLAMQRELERGRELLEDVSLSEVDVRPIREQTSPHVILSGVDDRVIFELRSLLAGSKLEGGPALSLPGVTIIDTSTRQYPFDHTTVTVNRSGFPGPLRSSRPIEVDVAGNSIHLIGWMRQRPFREDLDRRPKVRADGTLDRGYYQETDAVGSSGLESSAEDDLRGLRGLQIEQLDTGGVVSEPPTPGKDVKLTIDAELQARIAALMERESGLTVVQAWHKNKAAVPGDHLKSAVVVLSVDTGDILAMVSTPGFTRQQLSDDPDSVFKNDTDLPLLNRAIARPYPPGSIVKPLMLAAAATEGVFDINSRIDCTGHLFPGQKDRFRCWIAKPPINSTHTIALGHHLDASEAIMVSCNIFFYTIGQKLGPERIVRWYEAFGCGPNAVRPRLGVGDQFTGVAGPQVKTVESDEAEMVGTDLARSPVRPSAEPRRGVSPSEAILMGIGQGPVAWTPLHAADAYATLAKYGQRIVPRMRFDEPARTVNLNLDRGAVDMALLGLEWSVGQEMGTGHHIVVDGTRAGKEPTFNVPGIRVWGKSGTADSGLKAKDAEGNFIRELSGLPASIDHSWFVVLAGPESTGRPTVAVAVIVENGGSGGRVAGPLCNQVLRALVDEQYLVPGAQQ